MSYQSVRFQQLLPFQLQPQTSRDDEDPGPLFSPTLAPGTQNVLHSIFSPGAKSTGPTFSSRAGVFQEPAVSAKQVLKTPGKPKGSTATRKTSPRTRAIHFEDNGSPRTRGGNGSPRTQGGNGSPRTQGESFYSSSQTAIGSPFSPFSIISRITNATTATRSSFQSLPAIKMLSLDYIKSTSSIKELRKIVNFLKEQDNKYPSLLRAAQERLTNVQQQQRASCDSSHCENVPLPVARPAPPDYSREQEKESSLIMSLSSDDDSDLVMMSTAIGNAVALNNPVPPPRKRVSPGRLHPVGSKPDATRREEELCNEIQCLTSKLLELESGRLAEQKELWHNLEKMEGAKLRAEENMEALHGQVAKTNKDTMARLVAMGELKKENQRLQKQLDRERKTRETKNREALEVERQLKAKVEELTQKLSQIETPSNHVAGVEQKNKELRQLLCSAQNNLDDIKRERNSMLQDLLNATGRDPSAIKQLSKKDRSQLVLDIAKEAASSKAALNAMARTLAESENDRYEAMQAQQRVEAQLEATIQSSHRLEWDNLQLTRELQHLSDELTASRAYTDEFMSSARANQQKAWEKQEAVYKKAIRGLKQQLRTDEAVVSMELYKSAVEEGKTKVSECESYQEKVSRLNLKVAQLEWKLQGWQTKPDKENSSTLILPSSETAIPCKKASKEETTELQGWQTKPDKENSTTLNLPSSKRVITSKKASKEETTELQGWPTKPDKENSTTLILPSSRRVITGKKASKEETNENKAPLKTVKTERRNVAFTCVPSLTDKIEGRKRITMVRAAGGRKGLKEKLNQARSPRADRAPLQAMNI